MAAMKIRFADNRRALPYSNVTVACYLIRVFATAEKFSIFVVATPVAAM
jgi:hypothetical protein